MNADPHAREYLAAVSGLPDQTISPPITKSIDGRLVDTYEVGNRVKFRHLSGHLLYGVVTKVIDAKTYEVRRHVPDVGTETHLVNEQDFVPW